MSLYIGRELFFKARLAAIREVIAARLMGKNPDLLPFNTIIQALGPSGTGHERRPLPEVQSIPLDRIAGSTGRHRDFTRQFRPRYAVDSERWARLDAVMAGMEGLPPIEVFQIGHVYFVANGNHRVSVARASGFREIEAWVTVIIAGCDLEPNDSLHTALLKAERASFLAQTQLGEMLAQPNAAPIAFRKPGGYPKLLAVIAAHQSGVSLSRAIDDGCPPSFAQTAAAWYTQVYQPAIAHLPRPGLIDRLHHRTPAERYLARLDPKAKDSSPLPQGDERS